MFFQLLDISLSFSLLFSLLQGCGSSSLWCLLQWLFRVYCLGELVSVFWRLELDVFSLGCNEVSSSEFLGVYGFGRALGSLSFNIQGCVSVLLEN